MSTKYSDDVFEDAYHHVVKTRSAESNSDFARSYV